MSSKDNTEHLRAELKLPDRYALEESAFELSGEKSKEELSKIRSKAERALKE